MHGGRRTLVLTCSVLASKKWKQNLDLPAHGTNCSMEVANAACMYDEQLQTLKVAVRSTERCNTRTSVTGQMWPGIDGRTPTSFEGKGANTADAMMVLIMRVHLFAKNRSDTPVHLEVQQHNTSLSNVMIASYMRRTTTRKTQH